MTHEPKKRGWTVEDYIKEIHDTITADGGLKAGVSYYFPIRRSLTRSEPRKRVPWISPDTPRGADK